MFKVVEYNLVNAKVHCIVFKSKAVGSALKKKFYFNLRGGKL